MSDIDIRSTQEVVDDHLAKRDRIMYRRRKLEKQQIEYMQTETYRSMLNPIAVCRGVMRETLNKDEGFRQAYIANIAMTIYDNSPGITNLNHCNRLAELILEKVFGE